MRTITTHARRLALYLLVYPLLTSCERSPDNTPNKPHALHDVLIVAVGPGEDDPQWPGVRGGVERLFADIPSLRGHCVVPHAQTPAALRAAVERALEWKPNVICLFVSDVDAVRPCIDLIARRQVMLVTMGQDTGDPRVSGHVGVDLPAAAEQLGENLSRIAAGRQSYVLVHEAGRSETARNCYRRFSAAAQYRYDLTLLKEADASAGARTPAELVEQLLGLFPHAGLIVTLNPEVWLTAPAGWWARLHGFNGDFRFTTLAAAPRLWPRLGTPASPGDAAALLGPLDGEIGYAAAQLAVQLMISTDKPPSSIMIPCELVTADNLADFARRYAAAAGGNISTSAPVSAVAPAPAVVPASRR
jgi:ABC-type sugar transport system substrate-binding protein